jgi:hypothetical protein
MYVQLRISYRARNATNVDVVGNRGKVEYFSGALFLNHTIDGADRERYNGHISLGSLLWNEAQSCFIVKWHLFKYRQGQKLAYVATWDTQRLTVLTHPPAITSHTNSCHLASHSSFFFSSVSLKLGLSTCAKNMNWEEGADVNTFTCAVLERYLMTKFVICNLIKMTI